MNVKEKWINEFIHLLNVDDPKIDSLNPDYSYQLATAYFDWDTTSWIDKPSETVEKAFERFKLARREG